MTDTSTAQTGTATTDAATTTTETTAAQAATETTAADKTTETKSTILDTAATADKTVVAPADWPTDWRQKVAGDDKDFAKRLERMGSPLDMAKSYRALEQKLSSGEYKKVAQAPGADAKPEEIAAWRKEQGLPEKAEAYLESLQLPNGVVLGEADKPIAGSFAEMAHGKNWTQSQYNEAVDWYFKQQDTIKAQQETADDEFRTKSEDDLRAEWGQDYRRNLTGIQNMLSGWPEDLAASLLAGRDPSGRKFGDNPAFLKQLAALSREINPIGTLVPAGTGDQGKTASERVAQIETMMKDRQGEYYKGPNAEKLQQEYRDLVDAQAKMKSRAA